MNTVIICEGNTDWHLIGFYLEKKRNYSYDKESNFFNIHLENNQTKVILSKKENNIAIVSSGGKTRIKKLYEKIKNYISYIREDEKLIDRIIIMMDRDDDTDADILTSWDDELLINQWKTINIPNQLFDNLSVQIFLLVIPSDSPGAIERFAINALKDKYEFIVERIENIVNEIHINTKNLDINKNDRYRDKAKLGCILSILEPNWSLDKLSNKIRQIKWEELDRFNKLYSRILE